MRRTNSRKITGSVVYVMGCVALFATLTTAQESASTNSGSSTSSSGQTQDQIGGYDIKSSFEFGVRAESVDGNKNKFRSDLNYRQGFRVFDSTFLATAADSEGKPFDSLLITGTGWDADRNGFARVNMEKTGWYKFNSTVRRFQYFNNLQNFALNQHNRNTNHTMGDFDLTILPQNDVRFRFGYSFDRNSGPQFVTYDFSRDEFPVSSEYDTDANDIRGGVDFKLLGFNVSFTEGYRRFRENTTFSIDSLELGNNPNPNASISSLTRELPTRGRTNYHRLSFHRNFEKRVDVTGRLMYSDTDTDFTLLQRLSGTDRFGNTVILDEERANGDATRPNTFGDFGITVFVTDKVSISNTFGFNSYRITGGRLLTESLLTSANTGTPAPIVSTEFDWRLTNYRRYINTLEGNVDVNRYFSFYLGYRYTDRRIILEELEEDEDAAFEHEGEVEQTNRTNSLLAGFKAKPVPGKWTIYFDLIHGESDNAFTRASNYDTTQMRIRNQFNPTDELSLNFLFETKDNTNPTRPVVSTTEILGATSEARNFSASFSWMPNTKVTVNGGYSHNRLTSESNIVFPRFGPLDVGLSRYLLRSNHGYFDVWLKPHPRFSIFGAYRITKDTGSGDFLSSTDSLIVGNYPLQFQSPEVRGIFRINDYIDWNVGYQFYDYDEKMMNTQNYRAHLPYTSLRIYLGGSRDR